MPMDFLSAVKNRRTIYGLSRESVVSDDKILEIVDHAVLHSPSAFNSQSARVVVLLNDHHTKLWSVVKETLRKIVPEGSFAQTEEKLKGFAAAYGTILFFEDQSVVEDLQANFNLYKDNFPLWSLQASGMLQYVVWTALEVEGFGASLQHYNPLIDDQVHKEWNLPSSWRLMSQMPFGKPTAPPNEKDYMPLEERIRVFK